MNIKDKIRGKLGEPIEKILFSQEEIQQKVKELGERISLDFMGKDLIMVCVLKGSLYFTADLIRQISIPLTLDFMAVSSYGDATKTSGIARITKDLEEDIEGRSVVLVEDILDTGLTLDYLIKVLQLRNPMEIKVCTMLDKPSHRIKSVRPRYVGFEIPDLFVVGYGLDFQHKYRHLPFICTFKPECYPDKEGKE